MRYHRPGAAAVIVLLLSCSIMVVGGDATTTNGSKSITTRSEALRELGLFRSTTTSADTPVITAAEIKAAYRQRSLETHPDKPGGSASAFVRVSQAYEFLLSTTSGSGTVGGGCPTSSSSSWSEDEEQRMRQAMDLFLREFQDLLENTDQVVDRFVDQIFTTTNTGGGDSGRTNKTTGDPQQPEELSFWTRQAKWLTKFVARRLVHLFQRFILEADHLQISINGQTLSVDEVHKIREILQKNQQQRGKQQQLKDPTLSSSSNIQPPASCKSSTQNSNKEDL
jgi:curved DNA-binding protein CbpA